MRTSPERLALTLPLLCGALLCGACGATGGDVSDDGGNAAPPPPAAALSAEARLGLPARLEQLDADLAAVLDSDLDDQGEAILLRAEAATDRLLEEQPERAWLASGYYVEARLRQIQALADRIVSELRRGVTRELVLEDIASLRHAVTDLRQQLAADGSRDAPPPLDSLLAASAADTRPAPVGARTTTTTTTAADTPDRPAQPAEPTVAPAGGLLGEPIQP